MSDAVKEAKAKLKETRKSYRNAARNLRASKKYGSEDQIKTCQERHDSWKAKLEAAKIDLKAAQDENPSKMKAALVWGGLALTVITTTVIITGTMMGGKATGEESTADSY